MPAHPSGANGVRLPEWNAVKATAQKNSSTAIFRNTMTVLARALSDVPRSSSRAAISTTTTAGTLTSPPSPGGLLIAAGIVPPTALSKNSFR